jgi:myosin heavy subunit
MKLDGDGGRGDADGEEWDDVATLEKLGLSEYDMEDFRLINASDTYDRRDGVSDARTFRQMRRSMSVMGFSPEDVFSVLRVVSALLHASNLAFVAREDCCALDETNAHLRHVVDLLGITTEGLNSALCYHEITVGIAGDAGKKQFKRVLSRAQAEKGVEALIKGTYAALFNYLVSRINASVANVVVKEVEWTKASRGGGRDKKSRNLEKEASVGILVREVCHELKARCYLTNLSSLTH